MKFNPDALYEKGEPYADLEFMYDAMGNRVMKVVKPRESTGHLKPPNSYTLTFYLRDAQGNVLSVMQERPGVNEDPDLFLQEQYVYGSQRIGKKSIKKVWEDLPDNENMLIFVATRNNTFFEISNHLGNVHLVLSDYRSVTWDADDTITGYHSVVSSSAEYYPFGMVLIEGEYNSESYRYGFNAMERDDEIYGVGNSVNFTFRMYNTRLGRFMSPDPIIVKQRQYPWYSPYQFAGNMPIWAIDLEGLQEFIVVRKYYDDTRYKTMLVRVPTDEQVYESSFIIIHEINEPGSSDNLERIHLDSRHGRSKLITSGQLQSIEDLTIEEKSIIERYSTLTGKGILRLQGASLTVKYDFDKGGNIEDFLSSLSDSDTESLKLMAALANAADVDATIEIIGYASDLDTRYGGKELCSENNEVLAHDRAKAVRDYLVDELGVSPDNINESGLKTPSFSFFRKQGKNSQ